MARKKVKSERDSIVEELEAIKRLLVAILANDGVTQDQIAKVLQVSQPSVSRMLPSSLGSAKRKNRT